MTSKAVYKARTRRTIRRREHRVDMCSFGKLVGSYCRYNWGGGIRRAHSED